VRPARQATPQPLWLLAMFQLARVQDTVHIQPSEFGKSILVAVRDALNCKYPNKVVRNLGLCVALFDILHIGESHLHPGSAAHHTAVEFRIVVFRPYVGEILTGNVVSCDDEGVRITLGFFDDIRVPKALLQEPSSWSPEESLWVWDVDTDHQLFLDLENPVRFRVHDVVFPAQANLAKKDAATAPTVAPGTVSRPGTPTSATATSALAAKQQLAAKAKGGAASSSNVPVEPHMRIIAGVDRPGLGLTAWWPSDQEDAEPDDGMDDGT